LNFGGTKEGENFSKLLQAIFNSKYHTWGGTYSAISKMAKNENGHFDRDGIKPNAYDLL